MELLEQILAGIKPPDCLASERARRRQDTLTKPAGSLGELESLSVRIAGMQRRDDPQAGRGAVFVMAGDHGVCAEGISAYPPEVTAEMVLNFVRGGAAINVLARQAGLRVVIADVGVAGELPENLPIHRKRIGPGTKNMACGPAMSRPEAVRSIEAGIEVFELEWARESFDIAATGDMGIGNTTPSSALASLFLGKDPRELTGRGTGIDEETFERKVAVIRKALEVSKPVPGDPVGALAAVGGFEIGALAGVMLASAARGIPVVIDGYISGAAALLARALCPEAVSYMIAGHVSADGGHQRILQSLGLKPLLDLGMRLGEGTGAVLALNLCAASCLTLNEMATFESAEVRKK